MNNKTLTIVAAALAVVGVGAYAVLAMGKSVAPLDADEQYWSVRIGEVGGKKAHREFAQWARPLSQNSQHTGAHEFGAALYATEGASGLAACDARFSFGCFHEFLGQAVADKGLAVVTRLNDTCREVLRESILSCQHGIGHGVIAQMGYKDEHLHEALTICEDLPFSDPIGGCFGGVFMEYNMRTMLAEDATLRENTGLMEPCASLRDPFAKACYYWQPQWWVGSLSQGLETVETFSEMGSLCESLPREDYRRSCFEGIGNMAAQRIGFSAARAREHCDAVSLDPHARLLCRSVAANHIGVDASVSEGRAVCEGLPPDFSEYCLSWATNQANIAHEIDLP